MDKQEAIERLKQNKAAAEFYAGMVQNTNAIENELKDIEAIDMAIEALSADTVSREEHYDAVANRITDMEERGFVSVVRCKDCKHLYNKDFCSFFGSPTNAMDYCSYGERREPCT